MTDLSTQPNARIIPANDPGFDPMILEMLHQLADLMDALPEASQTHKHVASELRRLRALLEADRGERAEIALTNATRLLPNLDLLLDGVVVSTPGFRDRVIMKLIDMGLGMTLSAYEEELIAVAQKCDIGPGDTAYQIAADRSEDTAQQ